MLQRGFTLIELLVVIAIMGLLLSVMIPAGNIIDTNARIQQTEETFTALRTAILGPQNIYDESGNRKLGGYVGDVGKLPRLYKLTWNSTQKKLLPQLETSPNLHYVTTTNNDLIAGIDSTGDDAAQPLALWLPDFADSGDTIPPYLSPPIDPMPDDLINDYDAANLAIHREYLLREGQGRLVDGWGRALLIYVDDENQNGHLGDDTLESGEPNNLVFVSAGADGNYNDSADNRILKITKADWDLEWWKDSLDIAIKKKTLTLNKMQAIKTAIIGRRDYMVNGNYMPNGFIADIGNIDLLRPDPFGLSLLLRKKHYVSHQGKTYYYSGSSSSDSTEAPGTDSSWKRDNGFPIVDTSAFPWEKSLFFYSADSLDSLIPDDHLDSGIYIGRKGSYLQGLGTEPITDAWGRQIELNINLDTLIIISLGADTSDADDDLFLSIDPAEYKTQITLKIASAIIDSGDVIKLFYPKNGKIISSSDTAKTAIDTIFDSLPSLPSGFCTIQVKNLAGSITSKKTVSLPPGGITINLP